MGNMKEKVLKWGRPSSPPAITPLSVTLLPLGTLSKSETRRIAAANALPNAGKPDSQDICFAPDGDYAGFIERRTGCGAGDSSPEGCMSRMYFFGLCALATKEQRSPVQPPNSLPSPADSGANH
jgi:hypothetical protein